MKVSPNVFLLLALLCISCWQNSHEKALNGKWYDLESEKSTVLFYPDSLLINWEDSTEEQTYNWKASQSEIEYSLPTWYHDSSGKLVDTINYIKIHYQLSDSKDSLYGTIISNYGTSDITLLKSSTYLSYLNRKYNIQFNLPKNDMAEPIKIDDIYGMKVFMGIVEGTIVSRTELFQNLLNFESDMLVFRDSIRPYTMQQIDTHEGALDRRFHLRVFADKNIHDTIITNYLKGTIRLSNAELDQYTPDRFKGIKRDTLPVRIFRIFETEEKVVPWNLRGIQIESKVVNVYD